MVLKRFFKFIFSDGYDYSRFQRALFMSISFFILFLSYPLTRGGTLGIEFMVIMLPIAIVYVFQDFLAEKFGRLSDVRVGYTYEYVSVIYSFYIPSLMILIFWFCDFFNQRTLGIFLDVACLIPLVALLRRNPFCDANCVEGDLILFGYHPICAEISMFLGFSGVYNAIKFYNVDLNYFILCLCVIFMFQIMLVCPHIFNKFLPFEVRTKKGCVLFVVMVVVLYAIVIFLLCGDLDLIINNFTVGGFLRKLITYTVVIILAILFYRQYIEMNKKD